ncbi:MAG TPA: ribonuclease Y [bacterium]|nr:ribonuclease Y [bacterium]
MPLAAETQSTARTGTHDYYHQKTLMIEILLGLAAGAGISALAAYTLFLRRAKANAESRDRELAALRDADERRYQERKNELEDRLRTERAKLDEDRSDIVAKRRETENLERKLVEKDERIEKKIGDLDKKLEDLYRKEQAVADERKLLDEKKAELEGKLAEVARLSQEEARNELFRQAETRYERDFSGLLEKKRIEYKTKQKEIAREILIGAIQQYSSEVTGEMTQTMITLESDDLKGKLIGKEGRNITAFERSTGVSLIIDDTPDTVFLSSFDLFRRYIAKKTLEDLIADKRIQPARIEEIAEKNQREAEKLIAELGEKTLTEMGITGIPVEIVPLIGKFRFRTSYGQNILTHSKEVAYIAEAIAKLIGADPALALKGGLLHDLGKAMDHDIEGTHPEIGGRIARKYGLDEKLVNIIEGHHDDVPQICIETKIVQIADAISAIRPGARRINADQYVKRIQEMENLVASFSGVNKAYALSAGREVRIFVDAETISDREAEKMAQDIAESIESNLSYPGEIKVNLIRERRIVEYAR